MDQFFECECGKVFEDGDTIYFKPVPYVASIMTEDVDVEIAPVCEKCIMEYSISKGSLKWEK